MHEWALADAIVRTVLDYAQKEGASRVKAVKVVLGELQDVGEDIVKFAMEELFRGTIAEGAEIIFEEEEAVFKCRNCGHVWKLKEVKDKLDERIREDIHFIPEVVHAFLSCPKCGSHDFEVVKGRGVYISGIMIEKEGEE
ncbi:hydrogenase nickel insertion protein HypA [Pyrococcus furiosus DSM 3638]|uniref:Hydrogenase maturation factor HypA n=3 Tax=Pyrococcus furiosus TaxID=2261 RepID=HYPA_PYRFU|nr:MULTISPECIES: hydrogenase nickel incorporation protein HypA [Pyrococcus]Q8U357.1 RecName: Full=Hydrogenase maturation factor HypA [Pyrococcus furiosus DSM 3638]AAL80739.1 hydrogenase expression/formation protein [Pyrococcus furiosus DSM 3638]AFN03408.1 hydrogenase nickel incorporation protein [Pyrococcus furiosus COM1]MDK2869630.1 hydrogenase nickel incorporation protein HypA/HybF [Pyrococcus sp.]QEK78320.1 hydrogenase nickel insertion protein HypA [Pyrococcus furiosus DSM 3638]